MPLCCPCTQASTTTACSSRVCKYVSLQEDGCSPEVGSLRMQHALPAAALSGGDRRPSSRPAARHGHRHNHFISSAFGASQQAVTTAHPAGENSDGGLRSPGEAFAPLVCACMSSAGMPPILCRQLSVLAAAAAANLPAPLARCCLPQGAKARMRAAFTDMADGYSEWVVDRHLVPGMFRAFVTELEPQLRGREGAQVRLGQFEGSCGLVAWSHKPV